MAATTKPKQSLVGIELVRLLAYEGDRIFTTDRARELAPRVGLKDAYVAESPVPPPQEQLDRIAAPGPLRAVFNRSRGRGCSRVRDSYGLVEPSVIAYWSALHHHVLTGQIPTDVFVQTTKGTWIPRRRNGPRNPGNGYSVAASPTDSCR